MDKHNVIMEQVGRISRRRDKVRSDHMILVEDLGYTHEEANRIIMEATLKHHAEERRRVLDGGPEEVSFA